MTKIPSTWNDNTLICRNVACFVQLLHHTQITMSDHVGKWVGHVGFLKHAKLQYPQWRGHWKSTLHSLSCQFFTQNAAEPICQSKKCIQLMLPRGGPNGVDAPLQYPTAFWRRAWKRPRDLQIQRPDPTRCLEDPSLSGLRIAPIISTCCQSHVLWTFTVQLLVSYPLRPPIVLLYAFCILCATPGKLPHCLCCQGTHIVVCTCHHVISVWIVPDKDMAQDIAPTHPQCRHSCTAESFSPKVWNQKTRKQIAKICKKKTVHNL